MILTCPSCGTQYNVKDGAIPPEGRKVRCAACGDSWHEPGTNEAEGRAQPEAETEAPAQAETSESEGSEEVAGGPPVPDWPTAPEEEETVVGQSPVEPIAPGAPLVEAPNSIPVPPADAEDWAIESDDESPEELAKEIPDREEIAAAEGETAPQRRRNWWMAIIIGLIVVAIVALVLWFIAPDSIRRGMGMASVAPVPLQIAAGTPERQKLASGNELVVVSGRVINPSPKLQPVPPIEAQLRDKSGRLVYSWTIAPPAPTLPPGGSASFNSAEVGVPASGPDSTITFLLKS